MDNGKMLKLHLPTYPIFVCNDEKVLTKIES